MSQLIGIEFLSRFGHAELGERDERANEFVEDGVRREVIYHQIFVGRILRDIGISGGKDKEIYTSRVTGAGAEL